MVLCEETNDSGSDSIALTTSIRESILLHNLSASNQLSNHFIHKAQAVSEHINQICSTKSESQCALALQLPCGIKI